jgi:hypothetical protein
MIREGMVEATAEIHGDGALERASGRQHRSRDGQAHGHQDALAEQRARQQPKRPTSSAWETRVVVILSPD